jgi:hypothetical protein
MVLTLADLVTDFADSLAAVDATRAAHKAFQPGIGPFGEVEAVRAALARLRETKPPAYRSAVTKRLPDLLIPGEWAVDLKLFALLGTMAIQQNTGRKTYSTPTPTVPTPSAIASNSSRRDVRAKGSRHLRVRAHPATGIARARTCKL